MTSVKKDFSTEKLEYDLPFLLKKKNEIPKFRVKWTLVTRPVELVTQEKGKYMLKEKVHPAIRDKFPRACRSELIFVQQDNAKYYLVGDDQTLSREFG